MKVRKVEAELAAREKAAAKSQPVQFNHVAKIASMRREYFKEVDDLCATDILPYPMPETFPPGSTPMPGETAPPPLAAPTKDK